MQSAKLGTVCVSRVLKASAGSAVSDRLEWRGAGPGSEGSVLEISIKFALYTNLDYKGIHQESCEDKIV